MNNSDKYPVIVCIAKREQDYIEEWVKYHIALGFKYIYLYDNEDTPTYELMLDKYKDNIKVIHLPFNNYNIGVQYVALEHFVKNYLFTTDITHVTHIDIDEFIVLKKHENICDFINQYIIDDCHGIGMNWRFFGSSGKTEKTSEPVTERFTMCQKNGNCHIKTLFKRDNFLKFNDCHSVMFLDGYTKSTNNDIIIGPFNHNIDLSVIQLNHYRSKTFPEFLYCRSRGRADGNNYPLLNDIGHFNQVNINEIEDLDACNFYKKIN